MNVSFYSSSPEYDKKSYEKMNTTKNNTYYNTEEDKYNFMKSISIDPPIYNSIHYDNLNLFISKEVKRTNAKIIHFQNIESTEDESIKLYLDRACLHRNVCLLFIFYKTLIILSNKNL